MSHFLQSNYDAEIEQSKNFVRLRMSAQKIIQVIENFQSDRSNYLEVNRGLIDDILVESESREKFSGGKTSEMLVNCRQGIDLKKHRKAMQEIEQGDLGRRLKALHDSTGTRRRLTTSDNDGDFVFERRFEEKPFILSKKAPTKTKIIELKINLGFSASVKSKSIDQFACLAWSIIQLIESKGIQCRVVLFVDSHGADNSELRALCEVVAKESNQYLSPSRLAASISSVFFRRAMFSMIVLACDAAKNTSYTGLGRPQKTKSVKFDENGSLVISADAFEGTTYQDIDELKKALNFKG
jgi:hypothetical protein